MVGVTGTTGLTAVRWLTGHWIPSWQQLVNNPYFAAYVLLTVSLGAAITFLYDDRSNPKINTVIKVRGMGCLDIALTWTASEGAHVVATVVATACAHTVICSPPLITTAGINHVQHSLHAAQTRHWYRSGCARVLLCAAAGDHSCAGPGPGVLQLVDVMAGGVHCTGPHGCRADWTRCGTVSQA